jgi:uncharacterized protein
MPFAALPVAGLLPTLTIFDRADPPARRLLAQAEQILELGGGRNLWAARLDEAVRLADARVTLVAHGVGCFAVAWWARLSPACYVEKVAGALFVRPLARVMAASPDQRFAGPNTRLPFASQLIDSGADAVALAREWGSRLLDSPGAPSVADLVAALRLDTVPQAAGVAAP